MITTKHLRNAGFIDYKADNSSSEEYIWANFTSKSGVLLYPNGKGAYIPYLNATLLSENLDGLLPCKQISSECELNELMKCVNKL